MPAHSRYALSMIRPECLLMFCIPLSGCNLIQADNAVFELEVVYPEATADGPDSELWARAQAAPESFVDGDIEATWSTGMLSDAIQLDTRSVNDKISLVASDGSRFQETGDNLVVKFHFCRSRDCMARLADSVAGEVWYRIGTPFYRGELTSLEVTVPGIPTRRVCTSDSDCTSIDACEERYAELQLANPDAPHPCSCTSVPGEGQFCFHQAGTNHISIANDPPVPTDEHEPTCSVRLGEQAPSWLCEVSKCRVRGCIIGNPNDWCEGSSHICETQ